MKLYRHKPISVGFSVLCPDRNAGTLRATVRCIRGRYPGAPIVAVFPGDVDVGDMGGECRAVLGQDTITSLINAGMNSSESDWTITIMAGSYARKNLDTRYSLFVTSEKDVLFPIVGGRTDFVDGTLNGIMIHRRTWEDVGEFSNRNPLGVCKLLWTMEAMEKGCTFKAIMGVKIC